MHWRPLIQNFVRLVVPPRDLRPCSRLSCCLLYFSSSGNSAAHDSFMLQYPTAWTAAGYSTTRAFNTAGTVYIVKLLSVSAGNKWSSTLIRCSCCRKLPSVITSTVCRQSRKPSEYISCPSIRSRLCITSCTHVARPGYACTCFNLLRTDVVICSLI